MCGPAPIRAVLCVQTELETGIGVARQVSQHPIKERVEIVHCLRGLAAVAVCWFHFTGHSLGLLKQSGVYGWLGVEVFFVISGFILPYALYSSGYRMNFTTY